MADGGWCLVDLAVPSGEEASRADRIRHWLLYEQVVIPNPTRDDLWQPSELAPGPAWRVVVGDGVDDEFLRIADNGVDVHAGWAAHGKAGESAPSCARCGCTLAADEHRLLLEAWDDSHTEPAVNCSSCGTAAQLSSWVGGDVALCGAMAVTFHHWPRPSPAFLLAAGHRFGSRVGFAPAG
jgi:hypothetical protein